MRSSAMALAAVGLLAATVAVAETKSGLGMGERVPAFQVVDVTGPSKGQQLCYRCQYGNQPMAAAFVKAGSASTAEVLTGLQQIVDANKAKRLRSFVVFMGGPELKGKIEQIATEKKISIPLTFLPQGASADDISGYKISADAENTILLWNRGTVQGNFVNVGAKNLDSVKSAAEAMLAK